MSLARGHVVLRRLLLLVTAFSCSCIEGRLTASTAPPMGWRSWGPLFLDIDQEKILAQARALVASPPGGGPSLKELGYSNVGVDDGWQACGDGFNGSFHDSNGMPLVNKTRFPDVAKMVNEIHMLGLTVSWYFNNCWCAQPELDTWLRQGGNPAQDVDFLVRHGIDGVKVDGCGPAHNITRWSELIKKTSVEMQLDNCADNGPFAWRTAFTPQEMPGWVPAVPADIVGNGFSTYRVSVDIAPQFYSAMSNLQHMEPFLKLHDPLSGPGHWADPDGLQVATKNPTGVGEMSPTEWRTQFATWCITSSPLVLQFDLTHKAAYAAAYPIISNRRAIEINQLWGGHPGRLAKSSNETFWALAGKHANDECENGDPSFCVNTTLPMWQLWTKSLPKQYPGGQFVVLVNLSPHLQELSFTPYDIGIQANALDAVDVWDGRQIRIQGAFKQSLEPHDSRFLFISPYMDTLLM